MAQSKYPSLFHTVRDTIIAQRHARYEYVSSAGFYLCKAIDAVMHRSAKISLDKKTHLTCGTNADNTSSIDIVLIVEPRYTEGILSGLSFSFMRNNAAHEKVDIVVPSPFPASIPRDEGFTHEIAKEVTRCMRSAEYKLLYSKKECHSFGDYLPSFHIDFDF